MQLEWSEHSCQLVKAISALMEQKELLDVTLSAEGKHLRVHRLILAAASDYFRELLTLDTDQPPIIYLRDVSFSELECLVQFVYSGKTDVPCTNLTSFLALANSLGIRGFAETHKNNLPKAKLASEVVPIVKTSEAAIAKTPSETPLMKTPLEASLIKTPSEAVIAKKQRTPTKRKLLSEDKENLKTPPSMKHSLSEPVELTPEALLKLEKKRRFQARSLDSVGKNKKETPSSSSSSISTPRSPLSALVTPPTWSNTKPPLQTPSLAPSQYSNVEPTVPSLSPLIPQPKIPSQTPPSDASLFKRPLPPLPLHASTNSCPVESTPQQPWQPQPAQPAQPAKENLSFDSSLPTLDPNQLAAKGATLLHHLALWMLEEKRLKEEAAELARNSNAGSSSNMAGNSNTFPPLRARNPSGNAFGHRGRAGSECDRPDSGFDSKDEGQGREGEFAVTEGTPTPPNTIRETEEGIMGHNEGLRESLREGKKAASFSTPTINESVEGSSASSPEGGEILRQAAIRQPVFRKRRMNNH